MGGLAPTGAGARRRPDLVALGLRRDGKKEIIDYRLAVAESVAEWEQFLTDLFRRGLERRRLEMTGVDGGAGLLAALPVGYPGIPVQRCWADKIRNVLNQGPQGRPRQGQGRPPRRDDLDELLTCFRYNTIEQRKAVRT